MMVQSPWWCSRLLTVFSFCLLCLFFCIRVAKFARNTAPSSYFLWAVSTWRLSLFAVTPFVRIFAAKILRCNNGPNPNLCFFAHVLLYLYCTVVVYLHTNCNVYLYIACDVIIRGFRSRRFVCVCVLLFYIETVRAGLQQPAIHLCVQSALPDLIAAISYTFVCAIRSSWPDTSHPAHLDFVLVCSS